MLNAILVVHAHYHTPPILLLWRTSSGTNGEAGQQSRCPNWKRKKQMQKRSHVDTRWPSYFSPSPQWESNTNAAVMHREPTWPIFSILWLRAYVSTPNITASVSGLWASSTGALNKTAPPDGKRWNQIHSVQTSNCTARRSKRRPCRPALIARLHVIPRIRLRLKDGGRLISLSPPSSPKGRKRARKRLNPAGEHKKRLLFHRHAYQLRLYPIIPRST